MFDGDRRGAYTYFPLAIRDWFCITRRKELRAKQLLRQDMIGLAADFGDVMLDES